MSQVVSFEGYVPPARFDNVPWSDVQVYEGPAVNGPSWTLIDTLTLTPPDADPTQPAPRDFTTAQATAPGLWYLVVFLDGAGGESLPTDAVQNIEPAVAHSRDLCTLADIAERTPGYEIGDDAATDAALADFITKESRDFMEVTRREITPITAGPSTRVFDVDWIVVEERELMVGDCAGVTDVVLKGQDGTVLQTLDPSAWNELPRVREDWEPISSLYFAPYVPDPAFFTSPASHYGPHVPDEAPRIVCEVTGTWGFPSIPDTVKRAVAVLVLLRYLNDAASVGTKLADAADRAELNLAGSLKAALDTRERFTIPKVGTSSITS